MALYYIRDSGTVTMESEEEIVVLSPSLYWYSHADFPTSSLAKARRLADSFLSSRPSSYRSIYVQKADEGFDCYAFDQEALSKTLKDLNITKEPPIYFLQQFISQAPFRVDEESVAETINGIVIEMKDGAKTLPSIDSLDFASLAKPINQKSVAVSKSLFIALIALLIITAAGDTALRLQKANAYEELLSSLNRDRSTYEIEALLKKYRRVESAQKELREKIERTLSKNIKYLECSSAKGCRYE